MNRMDVPMDSPLGKLLMQKIAAKEEADFEKLPKIAVENRARVLLDALEDWGKPCPFVRGNLVAPKDDREFPGGGVWLPEHFSTTRARERTHCKYGHEWTPENQYRAQSGYRGCIICKREYLRTWRKARNGARN